jgi:hypothetical protein
MAKRTADIPIPAKQAHDMLKKLLDRLAMADTSRLEPTGRHKNKGLSTTPDQWEEALRTAMFEIEEWCPTFTLTLPPREDRSTRK